MKKRYVQRDLEDQIMEELQSKSFHNHLETNLKTKTMSTAAAAPKREIKISEVLGLLDKGYTRLTKFDKGEGSIQSFYGLTNSQVKELFEAPKLKGRKTKTVSVIAIDDAPDVEALTIRAKTPKAAKPTGAATSAKAPATAAAASDSQLFS